MKKKKNKNFTPAVESVECPVKCGFAGFFVNNQNSSVNSQNSSVNNVGRRLVPLKFRSQTGGTYCARRM